MKKLFFTVLMSTMFTFTLARADPIFDTFTDGIASSSIFNGTATINMVIENFLGEPLLNNGAGIFYTNPGESFVLRSWITGERWEWGKTLLTSAIQESGNFLRQFSNFPRMNMFGKDKLSGTGYYTGSLFGITPCFYKEYKCIRIETEQQPVPEPATMMLFGTGLIGLAGFTKKRRIQKE